MSRRELPENLQVPWGVRDVLVMVLVWFGLQVVMGIFLAITARSTPAVARFLDQAKGGNVAANFALDTTGVLLGFGLVWLFLRKYNVGWKAVGWRRVSVLKTIGYLIGILVAFLVLAQLAFVVVKLLVPGFDPNQPQANEFTTGAGTNPNLAIIALVLLPPVFEETIFRGFMFPAIAKRTGLVWGAVLSSMIFGIAHGQPNLFVYTTILGLLLCFMYVRTKSIVPGILLHMVNNYLAFLAITSPK